MSNSEDGLVEVKGWWEEGERIGEFEINEYKNGFVSFDWGVVVKGEPGARLGAWASQGATKESLSLKGEVPLVSCLPIMPRWARRPS